MDIQLTLVLVLWIIGVALALVMYIRLSNIRNEHDKLRERYIELVKQYETKCKEYDQLNLYVSAVLGNDLTNVRNQLLLDMHYPVQVPAPPPAPKKRKRKVSFN